MHLKRARILQLTEETRFNCTVKNLSVFLCNNTFFRPGGDDGGPNVVVEKMSVVIEGRQDIDLDLTGLYKHFALFTIISVAFR